MIVYDGLVTHRVTIFLASADNPYSLVTGHTELVNLDDAKDWAQRNFDPDPGRDDWALIERGSYDAERDWDPDGCEQVGYPQSDGTTLWAD